MFWMNDDQFSAARKSAFWDYLRIDFILLYVDLPYLAYHGTMTIAHIGRLVTVFETLAQSFYDTRKV